MLAKKHLDIMDAIGCWQLENEDGRYTVRLMLKPVICSLGFGNSPDEAAKEAIAEFLKKIGEDVIPDAERALNLRDRIRKAIE